MTIMVIIVTIGTGAIWVRLGTPMLPLFGKAAPEPPKQLDMTNGQQMHPRWSEGEGAGYDAGYN